MNRRALEYAVRLAEVRSFSQLSEELGISQPALSKQIAALEQELGVKLFDRSTSPLSLTPAGAYFAEEAKSLLFKEDQLGRAMQQFRSGEAGRLTIGVSQFRCMYLMPRIVQAIREKFPGVEIVLHEDTSAELRRDVADGKFDLAILNLPVDESVLDVVPIGTETPMLAVPNRLAFALPTGREVAFEDCRDLPFVVVGKGQEMRLLFDKVCATTDTHPPIVAQVINLTSAWAMADSGIGATLLPLPFVNEERSKNLTLFTLKGNDAIRRPAVVTRRGQYLSDYAKYAIELLTQ